MGSFACFVFLFLTIVRSNSESSGSDLSRQYTVEVYWESYLSFPNDENSCRNETKNLRQKREDREELPFAFKLSSLVNFNINTISIAFADFNVDRCDRDRECREIVCGIQLFEGLDEDVFKDLFNQIQEVRSKGIKVKLAFGGDQWGNLNVPYMITPVADRIVALIRESSSKLGVDGVDLVQQKGCGDKNFRCGDQSSTHLYIIEKLRQQMPDNIISYTFPSDKHSINFPFLDVLKYGHQFLDSINVFGSTMSTQVEEVITLGVPKEKIVWGLPIACNDNFFGNVTLTNVQETLSYIKKNNLGGISLWSSNRDTDHRIVPTGYCTEDQTGLADGTFINSLTRN